MRGGTAGISGGNPVPFNQSDTDSFVFEEIRRGDTGEPSPDHHDVHLDITVDRGKSRK